MDLEALPKALKGPVAPRRRRPIGITVLSMFEFCKAGILLVVCAIVFLQPRALLPVNGLFRSLLSVALRAQILTGRHSRSAFLFVAIVYPLYAAVALLFGYGAWRLKKWAWYGLVYSSGITLGNWVVYALIDWVDTLRLLSDSGVQALVISDIVVFAYLMSYGARNAFGYWAENAE